MCKWFVKFSSGKHLIELIFSGFQPCTDSKFPLPSFCLFLPIYLVRVNKLTVTMDLVVGRSLEKNTIYGYKTSK